MVSRFWTRSWLVVLLSSLVGCSSGDAPPPVFVGQLLPLTGTDSERGKSAKQGAELALIQSRSKNPALLGHPIQMLHVDSKSKPELIRPETVRLVTVNKTVALIGSLSSAGSRRFVEGVRGYPIPAVTHAPGSGIGLGQALVLHMGASPESRAEALAKYVVANKEDNRIGIVRSKEVAPENPLLESLRKRLTNDDGKTVEEWTPEELLEETAAKESEKPTALVTDLPRDELRKFVKALKKQKLEVPILWAGDDVPSAWFPSPTGGMRFVTATAFTSESKDKSVMAFVKSYGDQFGETPDVDAALAFEGTKVLLETLPKAEGLLAEQVLAPLKGIEKVETVTGSAKVQQGKVARKVYLVERSAQGDVLVDLE